LTRDLGRLFATVRTSSVVQRSAQPAVKRPAVVPTPFAHRSATPEEISPGESTWSIRPPRAWQFRQSAAVTSTEASNRPGNPDTRELHPSLVAKPVLQMATQPSRAGTGAVAETQAALARRQPKPADAGGLAAWASGHCIRQREFYETGAAALRPSLPEPRLASERAMRPEKPRSASEVRTGRTGMPVWPPTRTWTSQPTGAGPVGIGPSSGYPPTSVPIVPGCQIKCRLPASLTGSSSGRQLTSYLVGCGCPVIISLPPAAGPLRDVHEFLRSRFTAAAPDSDHCTSQGKATGWTPAPSLFQETKPLAASSATEPGLGPWPTTAWQPSP
jgi:hypothetical protein